MLTYAVHLLNKYNKVLPNVRYIRQSLKVCSMEKKKYGFRREKSLCAYRHNLTDFHETWYENDKTGVLRCNLHVT
jgi:hypothetical protein